MDTEQSVFREAETFILIHGTFARGAPWTKAGSALVKTLEGAFPRARICRFDWSGGNSHQARLCAAQELRKYVRSDEIGEGPIFLIAHSHGGNVALKAISDNEIQRKVKGVICLATPFIQATAIDLTRIFKPFSVLAPIYVLLTILIPVLAMLSVIVIDFFLRFFGLPGEYAFAGVIYSAMAVVGLSFQLLGWMRKRLISQQGIAEQRQKQLLEDIPHGEIEVPVVAAFVGRDEAAFALQASYLLGDFPQRAWPLILFILKVSAWAAGVVLVGGAMLELVFGYGVFELLAFELMMLFAGTAIGLCFWWAILMALGINGVRSYI